MTFKKMVVLVILVFVLNQIDLNARKKKSHSSYQSKLSCLYSYHPNKYSESYYEIQHFDMKYRLTNYTNSMDYFSFTGKFRFQEFYLYLHFGPEIRFTKYLFANTTIGIYSGFTWIGFISETELGVRLYISKEIALTGIGTYQIFFEKDDRIRKMTTIKLGLEINL